MTKTLVYKKKPIKKIQQTPMLDKMSKVRDESRSIGQFIEWLGERDPQLYLCECAKEEEGFFPIYPNIEKLLAEFFDIDLNEAEKERCQILEAIRAQNSK